MKQCVNCHKFDVFDNLKFKKRSEMLSELKHLELCIECYPSYQEESMKYRANIKKFLKTPITTSYSSGRTPTRSSDY